MTKDVEKNNSLIGKVKCLNIQFYIRLYGVVDSEKELMNGAYIVADMIRERFENDEKLKPLGFQTVNHIINYALIDDGIRIEFLRCPICLGISVKEEASPDLYEPDLYLECVDCGYQWDDDGEYRQGANNEEIRI